MVDDKWKSLTTLLFEREEIANKRLKDNSLYLELCECQEQTEEVVERMYHERFTHEERIIIRRHYEGETEKSSMEIHESYIQGLKDCFQLVTWLGF